MVWYRVEEDMTLTELEYEPDCGGLIQWYCPDIGVAYLNDKMLPQFLEGAPGMEGEMI